MQEARLNHEYTQRSRSFLYMSIGATIAKMIGLKSVRFYENGVISLNLPVCAQVAGGRATRTTHPKVMKGFQDIISLVAGEPFTIENPFIWKTKADVVIPFFHWSEEYTHQANEQMRQVSHRAIDSGASMVLGSHPHWVQGVEWYNDHLITYSLGNFVFDQEQSLKTKQGVVLSTKWDGARLTNAKLTPVQIEQYYQPHVLEGVSAQEVLNNIYSNSWWPN